MTRDQIMRTLADAMPELRETFGVESMAIFGSAVRGERRPDSDLDVLVTFGRTVSLFCLAGLQRRLEELVGRPADVGTPDSLRAGVRDEVMREARRVA